MSGFSSRLTNGMNTICGFPDLVADVGYVHIRYSKQWDMRK